MRLVSKCILLLPMFGAYCIVLPKASQQPTISIESENPTVQLGHPIRIHIVLKNQTDREFTVFKSVGGVRGEQYYSVIVTGRNGNPASLTEYGAAIQKHQPVPGSRIMRTVTPGETIDEHVTVSDMFNTTAPGTYAVQVSRPSPLDPAIILKSNTLAIKVDNK